MTWITRRAFIAGSAAAATSFRFGLALAKGGRPDIAEVTGSDPDKMVEAALAALGGIKKFVRKGDFVVLKPNAGFANPADWATTTNPAIVVAVAKACLAAKAKQVMILEYPVSRGKKCIDRCGLTAALKAVPEVKVKVLAGADDFRKVKVKGGVSLKEVEVAKLLLSADAFINLPVAKHHSATAVSFGLKNAMGLIRDRRAFHSELDLHQAIADLGRVIKPDLTILDATRALLSNGPSGPGETSKPGRIIAGRKVTSVDAHALGVAKFGQKKMKPSDVKHIALAGKAGLGKISGLKIETLKV